MNTTTIVTPVKSMHRDCRENHLFTSKRVCSGSLKILEISLSWKEIYNINLPWGFHSEGCLKTGAVEIVDASEVDYFSLFLLVEFSSVSIGNIKLVLRSCTVRY